LDQSPNVVINGQTLTSPFAGGINSAQIQTLDVNGDQIEEWIIWDINARQLQVFEKDGDSFQHLPELSYLFPTDISGFLVLKDFDGDGKKDLFTSTALGIKAYKNTSQDAQLSWELAQDFLRIDGSGNIQANNLDIPLIEDFDEDGDLDLVIFNFASGDYLEFYENTSVDRTGSPDIDGFAFPEVFWGNFVFCGCGEFSFGETCNGQPINQNDRQQENNRIQHAGGHSILYEDFDGDGIQDLVLGRDECSTLYFLPNFGTKAHPDFRSFSQELPEYGQFPQFPIFHIAQSIEEELIVSLNSSESAFNFGIDFASSIVKIDLDGNQVKPFLQDQLVELGENSRPFFSGNKLSGELIMTANTTVNNKVFSQASRFSYSDGAFELIEEDYLQLSELNLLDVQYLEYSDVFLTNHFLISGIQYENNIPSQKLFLRIENGLESIEFVGYMPARGDYLGFFQYQSADYLLVAAQNGSLDLYQINISERSAQLLEEDFLGFSDNPANRNLTVAVQEGDQPSLYAVDQSGEIVRIENFMEAESRSPVLVEIGNQNLPTRLGRNTWISIVDDVFGQSGDLILGTRAGGLIYMKADESETPSEGEFQVKVYPNPTSGPIFVTSNASCRASLVNGMGQVILEDITIPANQEVEIQTQPLNPGLYLLRLEDENRQLLVKKIIVEQ